MNIISQFNKYMEKSFNDYLSKYFNNSNYWYKSSDFNNYYSFMNDLDSFSNSFIKDVIKSYFEYIDEVFFNSSYRKQFCISNGFYERKNFVTMFGDINFKRRYYFDKVTKEWFFFTDLFFNLPKKKHFDPFVCAELISSSAENSYSKAGNIVANKIDKRFKNDISISRATARNIVMSFNFEETIEQQEKRVERLFVMLDEKYVGSQFNKGKNHMIKAAVVFEGTEKEYKAKKKDCSKDRYRLVSPHTCASVENDLITDTMEYIYNTYDTDYLNEIYFMGDCAKWIKSFPKSQWFKFNPNIQIYSTTDGFHPVQAINQLTTKEHYDFRDALLDLIMNNDKELFQEECLKFMDNHKERTTIIIAKMEYIINNWEAIQLYINNNQLKCSMESHISHIFADLFSSRPKAYSKKGLKQLLKIRLLKCNGIDIRKYYLNNFNKTIINQEKVINNKKKHRLNYVPKNNKYDFECETKLPPQYSRLKTIKAI
ncbi:MAG: UPF0236 family transposase-like protein [Candidatus Coprovivens sp.]